MTGLADLQEAFQRAILDGEQHILGDLRDGLRANRDTLLAVYRDAYMARLLDVMDRRQARLRALMGQGDFDAMARAYIAARPSRSPSLRCFCQDLPAFLATTAPYAGRPWLSEFAAIEAAFADAFDAPDGAVPMESNVLPAHGDWVDLVVMPHPSVRRLDLSTNALALWSALDQKVPSPAKGLEETEHLIVWRQGFAPTLRRLPAEEASLWDAACAGTPFGGLCEMAAAASHPDAAVGRIADYWRAWAGSGLLAEAVATR